MKMAKFCHPSSLVWQYTQRWRAIGWTGCNIHYKMAKPSCWRACGAIHRKMASVQRAGALVVCVWPRTGCSVLCMSAAFLRHFESRTQRRVGSCGIPLAQQLAIEDAILRYRAVGECQFAERIPTEYAESVMKLFNATGFVSVCAQGESSNGLVVLLFQWTD